MTITLQIVDIDDPSSVMFDLNDPTGANSALYGGINTQIVQDVDWGVPTGTPLRAQTKMRVIFRGPSYDALAQGLGRLAQYLAQGCTMKYVASGSTDNRYVDFDPSPYPVLLNGRATALSDVMTQLQTPDGIELQLSRIGIRGDKLDPAVNKLVSNPTMLRDSNADGTPDGWTIAGTPTLTISATQESLHVVAASNGHGVFQATGAASASNGQTWTLSCDVKVASGTYVLAFDWRTAADAIISTPFTLQTTTGWKRITVTSTAPATTDHIRARLEASGGASTFDVRNVQLELSSTASPFRVVAQTMNADPVATAFAQYLPVYNPSTSPAPLELKVAFPDAASAITEVDYGLLSNYGIVGRNRLADFLNGPNFAQLDANGNGWTVTLGTNTTSAVVAGSSGGNAAHWPSQTIQERVVLLTRTTLLDCLRGRYTVYVRAIDNAGVGIATLQLWWSGGGTPLRANDPVDWDLTDGGSSQFSYLDLGQIDFPEELNIGLGTISLELQAVFAGGGSLDFDLFTFVPADGSAFATVPLGAVSSEFGSNFGIPKDLGAGDPTWVAGSNSGTDKVLNAINEGAAWGGTGTAGSTGAFSGAGTHIVTFNFAINGGAFTYGYEVANVTDNTVVAGQSGLVTTALSSDVRSKTVMFAGVAAKTYQPRMTLTARTGGNLVVQSISHYVLKPVAQNEMIRTDPGSLPSRSNVESLDSSGNLVRPWDSTAIPFVIPPGLSLVYINPFEVPATAQSNEQQHTLARTMTVTPTVYPRFSS